MSPQQRAALVRESRLRKLMQKWGLIEQKIRKKTGAIAEFGPSEALKPSLIGKFVKWAEQVAGLRQKELDVISEIKEIEEKHQVFREQKRLRRAKPSSETEIRGSEDSAAQRPREKSWLWLIILWMSQSSERKKDQAPKNG